MYDQDRFVPVKQDEELDVKIEAVGEKGDGIAKKDGFVLFVPNVQVGDEVRIRVTKVLKKVGFAEVIGQSSGGAPDGEAQESFGEEEAPADDIQPEDSEDFGDESEDSGEDSGDGDSEEPAEEPSEEPKQTA